MGPTHRRATITTVAFISSVLLGGCVASPTVRAARSGNLSTLRGAIAQERAKCALGPAEVRELAWVTAERELATMPTSSGPADGATERLLARIDEARACTRALSVPLEKLASGPGDTGAAATLALLDGGVGDSEGVDAIRKHGASPSSLWRAVAARSASSPELGTDRRRFFTDGDERIRLAALRASLETHDESDATSLIEVARLDPNPLARSLAVRALGPIANEAIVLSLRDLYARADEGLRQAIVDAWGHPNAHGGLAEVLRTVETERGAPAIEAGRVLIGRGRERELAAIGVGAIVRGMQEGLARDRVLAVLDAPVSDPRLMGPLRKAAGATEPAVAAAAWSRLAEVPSIRQDALRALAQLAHGGSREALEALARLGDHWALGEVARDLASPRPQARLSAARILVSAGDFARAADVLADDDVHVRMTMACAILGTAHDR